MVFIDLFAYITAYIERNSYSIYKKKLKKVTKVNLLVNKKSKVEICLFLVVLLNKVSEIFMISVSY